MIFKGCLKRSCWDNCTKKIWDWHELQKSRRRSIEIVVVGSSGSGDISESDHRCHWKNGVWILDPCRWGLVGSWREFSRGSQPSPYMVEKLILRDGFADDEWCWCSKWDVFRHGECPTCRRSRCPSSWRCSVEWGGKRTGAAELEVGVKRKTWFPYCRSDHHEQGRSDRSGSGGGSAVGLEEKTHTVDEHSRGRRVWSKFEEIGLGALLNQFEKIGYTTHASAILACKTAYSKVLQLAIPHNKVLQTFREHQKVLQSITKHEKVLQSTRK